MSEGYLSDCKVLFQFGRCKIDSTCKPKICKKIAQKKVPPSNPKVAKKVPPANPTFAQKKVPPYIIINQFYLKRNTNNHMISTNKHKFQVAVEEDRKTQPELARTE